MHTLTHSCRSQFSQEDAEDSAVLLGLSMLLLTYLPASNLLVTVGFVVAERLLYLPR